MLRVGDATNRIVWWESIGMWSQLDSTKTTGM